MITTKTKGEAPTVPIARSFLEVSAGSVTLHLNAWKDGGCSILYFVVEYKPRYVHKYLQKKLVMFLMRDIKALI